MTTQSIKYNEWPFILVDGSSYLYRAYHALPPLTTSKGQPTGAIYGVVNMLKRLLKTYQPSYIAVVFDAKGKNFRHEIYPDYKANRSSMPDELRSQVEPLYAIIRAMGLPLLVIDGVEADDVIGTLAKQATELKLDTLISTGDKDLAQLVNPHIHLVNTMSNQFLDEVGVEKKFGIPPRLITDYLALVGDTSDNIPGINKVGPKTATKWLMQYGSIENLIQHANEIQGQVGKNLRANLEQIPLSKKLVTLRQNIPLPTSPQALKYQKPNIEKLKTFFSQLEFKNWFHELESSGIENNRPITKDYQTILSNEAFQVWLKRLKEAESFAIDTETTSLDYMDAELVGLSFAIKAGEAAYLPVAHDYDSAPQQLDRLQVLSALRPILESKQHKKIGHHLKYDKAILARYGIELDGIAYDTMLESYILDSVIVRHDLDSLALKYLQYKKIAYKEITGKGAKQKTFNQIPIDKATPYAAEDADIALQLHEFLWPKISSDKKLLKIFTTIEIPLLSVLSRMEQRGVLIDPAYLQTLSKNFKNRKLVLEQKIFQATGMVFNLNSPKQLQAVLYERLGLPILKKTSSGQPSTAEPILQSLALQHDVPSWILNYRSLSKLISTYTESLNTQINNRTHRIHTSYQQAVAATGRLSSSNPNLQNIPIRTEEGRKIRKAFIAPKNYKILAADYSQIELRIMAHLSQDKALLQDFKEEVDIHKATASKIFGITLDQVTFNQRRRAKAINFGLMYGMSAFGLSQRLGIERESAATYIEAYFHQYPGIRQYMDTLKKRAHEQGYVETLLGRRLYIPDIQSTNQQRRIAAERVAINAPLQGTAADLIKLAMIHIDEWLQKTNPHAHLLMQVHDELVFEIKETDLLMVKKHIKFLMENVLPLSLPLLVNIGIGDNWDEAH
jgi:DNA polymerase-1